MSSPIDWLNPAYNTVMGLIALGEATFLTNAQTID